MKCEYCDNPVPNGVIRCPSCGAMVIQTSNIVIEQTPETAPYQNPIPIDPYLYVDKKSHIVYIILAIVFGEIGVHNFYAGYIGRGIAQLLITVLTFGLLFWVSWFWAIMQVAWFQG